MTRCSAGHAFDPLETTYIGMQPGDPGEFLELHNCPTCKTSVSTAVHTDASVCIRCGHVILGQDDDTKCCVAPGHTLCLDCAAAQTDEEVGLTIANARFHARYIAALHAPRSLTLKEIRARAAQGG